MRVLWILCLLIGSITCVPVKKDYRSNNAGTSFMGPSLSYWPVFRREGMSSSPGSSSSLPSFDNAAQLPAPQSSGYGDSGLGGSYGGGYGSSASGYVGASYGYVAPHDESSNSGSAISTGAGTENPEPFFSDLSDLEPVYFYSSRSRYQRGQEAFAQTRYTPGEPIPPFPLSRRSRATIQPNAPAKAPTKGGF